MSWQPIETAPLDGTEVDLWDAEPHGHRVCGARWGHHAWSNGKLVGGKSWGLGDRDGPFVYKPTHWRHVPEPPEA